MPEREKQQIMIVDDTVENLHILGEMLKTQGYKVRPVPNGTMALAAARKDPPDLILLDIMMPELDGYDVCQKLKDDSVLKDVPVVFLSALQDTCDKVKAFDVGGEDYITKPFQFEEVQARVATHLKLHTMQQQLESYNQHLEQRVQDMVQEVTESQMAAIVALAKLTEFRDDDTGKHIERVQMFCRMLAEKLMTYPEYTNVIDAQFVETIFHATALHDIGKVGIPDSILLKPGKLTTEEFDLVKTHTTIGARTLELCSQNYPNNPFINMGILIARHHHEKWDGTGYPDGLSGENIPLPARIMAVVDVYDALVSERCYKKALPHEQSCQIISEGIGSHFDPKIVEAFMDCVEAFKNLKLA